MSIERPSFSPEVPEQKIAKALSVLGTFDTPEAKRILIRVDKGARYEITTPDDSLTFIGVVHSNDPKSDAILSLRSKTWRALEDSQWRSTEFMIEGRSPGYGHEEARREMKDVNSYEDAIEKYGESGSVLWAWEQSRMEGRRAKISSPEKPEEEIVADLVKEGFVPEELASYLALRNLTSILGGNRTFKNREQILDNLARTLYNQQLMTGVDWISNLASEEEISSMSSEDIDQYRRKILNEYVSGLNLFLKQSGTVKGDIITDVDAILDRNQDHLSMKDINDLSDPVDLANVGSKINQIAARWNEERDKYLVTAIAQSVADGRRPFAVFGAAHALHVLPALREISSQPLKTDLIREYKDGPTFFETRDFFDASGSHGYPKEVIDFINDAPDGSDEREFRKMTALAGQGNLNLIVKRGLRRDDLLALIRDPDLGEKYDCTPEEIVELKRWREDALLTTKKLRESTDELRATNPGLFREAIEAPQEFISVYHFTHGDTLESIVHSGVQPRVNESSDEGDDEDEWLAFTDPHTAADRAFDKVAPEGFRRESSVYAYPIMDGVKPMVSGRIALEMKVDPKRTLVVDAERFTDYNFADDDEQCEAIIKAYWKDSMTLEKFLDLPEAERQARFKFPEVLIPNGVPPECVRFAAIIAE